MQHGVYPIAMFRQRIIKIMIQQIPVLLWITGSCPEKKSSHQARKVSPNRRYPKGGDVHVELDRTLPLRFTTTLSSAIPVSTSMDSLCLCEASIAREISPFQYVCLTKETRGSYQEASRKTEPIIWWLRYRTSTAHDPHRNIYLTNYSVAAVA